MASVTAEVLLYFGTDSEDFKGAVDKIRFSQDPPLETREIIELIRPIYWQGYSDAKEDPWS